MRSVPRIPVDPTSDSTIDELRDFWRYEFAKAAMQAMVSNSTAMREAAKSLGRAAGTGQDHETVAIAAVIIADSMLAELEKR